jgi:hypothetical protein
MQCRRRQKNRDVPQKEKILGFSLGFDFRKIKR